ncbi:MAG: hypothetical protein HY727_15800 [Candidatus Rokubacteria bacterium]|nr:hypothetical protein [Candidatus Rokubacteria bacterium]
MKRLVALFVALAFAVGTAGFAVAQTTTTTPKEKAVEKKEEKKAEKKMAAKNATGTVKSATADSLVVSGKEKGKDAEWTFAVDTKTTIKKAGKAITATDLKAGDPVHVKYMEQDGKIVAQTVTVQAGGKAAKKEEAKEKAAANPCAAKK